MRALLLAALVLAGCARTTSNGSDVASDREPRHDGPLDRSSPDRASDDLGGDRSATDGPAADRPPDTRPPDTRPPDTRPSDTRPPDTRPSDTRPPDTRPPDTRPPDSLAPDQTPSCVTQASGFAGGSGSPLDPYLICSCSQLQTMSKAQAASFRLTTEIDCSATVMWNAGAGFEPVPFSGTFDGNYHLIKGLFIERPSSNEVALFGKVSGDAVIEKVGLYKPQVVGKDFVGSLAAYVTDSGWTRQPRIRLAFATDAAVKGGNYVGGLVGNEFGTLLTIEDSYFCGQVAGSTDYTGGLVSTLYPGAPSGTKRGAIRRSYVCGSITGPRLGAAFSYAWEIDVDATFSVATLPATRGLCISRFGNGAVTASYYTAGAASGGCGDWEPKGAAAFASQTHPVYTTWSFAKVWTMGKDGLPKLVGFALP